MNPKNLVIFLSLLILSFPAFAQTGSISGTYWNDLDLDGVQDPGEPGISGALMTLYLLSDENSVPIPATFAPTDSNGNYTYTDTEDADGFAAAERLRQRHPGASGRRSR